MKENVKVEILVDVLKTYQEASSKNHAEWNEYSNREQYQWTRPLISTVGIFLWGGELLWLNTAKMISNNRKHILSQMDVPKSMVMIILRYFPVQHILYMFKP